MSKKIALTFDDAPLYDGALFTGLERTNLIIEALDAAGVEATFFATPRDFDAPDGLARLTAYDAAGHLIANHTNTHPAASSISVEDFFLDVDAGSAYLTGFANYRAWFRFPFLDEGNTVEMREAYRDGLELRGFENGYVTADTFDWYMDQLLAQAVYAGEAYNLDAIGAAYVEMIVAAAEYFDALGNDLLGRSPVQTLLLHENDLAALFIDDAIAALRANGWEIVSADEAYADPIAEIETDTLMTSNRLAAMAVDAGYDPSIISHESASMDGLDGLLDKFGAFGPASVAMQIGTAADEIFLGTSGNDEIRARGGVDVIDGSAGNDIISGGGDEYDQVDYAGSASDYVASLLPGGRVRIEKPDGGVDLLSDIDGFWFAGEEAWYSLTDLLDASASGAVINGTLGDDYLPGTGGDDIINGRGGSDIIGGSGGSDEIDGGGAEYDQVDYDGASADYTFSANGDGTVSVLKPGGGVDTLSDIDGFWFGGEAAWYSLAELLAGSSGSVQTGTEGEDYLVGTGGDDTITALGGSDLIEGSGGNDTIVGGGPEYDQIDYDGFSNTYDFTDNGDGSVSVLKPGGGVDTLTSIEGFWFSGEEAWYSIEQLLFGANTPQPAPLQTVPDTPTLTELADLGLYQVQDPFLDTFTDWIAA